MCRDTKFAQYSQCPLFQQSGTQGVVKAQIVLKGGAVQEVNILTGPRVFHAAVKAAIMQYKCVADGAGAEVTVTQEFNFKID